MSKSPVSKKLRLGLIGTGVAARELYLPAFRSLSRRIELVACTNRTRKKAEAYAKLSGIPKVVDSAAELLALPEVEGVLVSLPIALQPAMVLEALEAGVPVMSEKPVAESVAAGRRLVKAAAKYGTPWLLGENYAFMSAVARMQGWVRGGKLGTIRLVEATQIAFLDKKNPYFRTSWRAEPAHVGGYISDAGVHVAHALRRVCGTPRVIKNLTAQFEPNLPPIDTALALLQFPSGAVGTWTSCFSAHHGRPMLRVYGSKGTAELHHGFAVLHPGRGKARRYDDKHDSFRVQFDHFVDVVKKGVSPAYSGADALGDLELIQSIVR